MEPKEYTRDQLKELIENMTGYVVIYLFQEGILVPVFYTPAVPSFSGLTEDEYLSLYGGNAAAVVTEADLPNLNRHLIAMLETGTTEATYRTYHKTSGFVWTHADFKLLGTCGGIPAVLGVFTNITDTIATTSLLLDNSDQKVYVIEAGTYDLLFTNAVARADKHALPVIGQTCYNYVRGLDAPCPNCVLHSRDAGAPFETIWYDDTRDKTYGVRAVPLTFFEKSAIAFFIDDLTFHINLEAQLQQEKEKYRAATEGANLRVYEYDIRNRTIRLPEHARRLFGVPEAVVPGVPESILRLFHPEDHDRVRRFFTRVNAGEKKVTDSFLMEPVDGVATYLRYTFTSIFDDSGKALRAYAVAEDITAQKREEANFQQTIQSILSANPDALCAYIMDLTANRCGEGHGVARTIQSILRSDTADGFFERLFQLIPDAAQRETAAAFFNRRALCDAFAQGKVRQHLDYQRKNETGGLQWVRTYVNLLSDPEAQNVIGVFYSLDITRARQQHAVFDIITRQEYDYVALYYPDSNQIRFLNLSPKLLPLYHQSFGQPSVLHDFDAVRRFAADTWIDAVDRDHYLAASTRDRVVSELKAQEHFELSIRGHYTSPPYEFMCRKIQHYYLDESRDTILIVQTDVTETYLQQQKETEHTLIETVNSLPTQSVLFRVTADRRMIPHRYSDAFLRMTGYAPGDALPEVEDAASRVHPDDISALQRTLTNHLPDREPFDAIFRIHTKPGTYIWVSVNFTVFTFGDTSYLYGIFTDIDDLKRQEEQLAAQYDSAQTYLDSVAGTFLATRRVNLTQNKIELVMGLSPIAAIEKQQDYDTSVAALITFLPRREDKEAYLSCFTRQALLEAYAQGSRSFSQDYQFQDDSDLKWVRCSVHLTQRPGSGDIIAFFAVSDINQEKLVQSIMDQVVATQYDNIVCLDANSGRILFFLSNNQSRDDLDIQFGDDYETVMARFNAAHISPSEQPASTAFMTLANVTRTLDAGRRCITSFSMEENGVLRAKQIEYFYVDRTNRWIALLRTDFTETQKKQLEQEKTLHLALDAAQKANEAKSDFLSRMSHDIRTPLNGIIGMTYLTQKLDLPDAARDNLGKITTASKFLLNLINDILDMSKAESGRIELHPEPYFADDFARYIDAVIRPLCDDKEQRLTFSIAPIPGVVPMMDILRINQIYFNLLSNAVKYTPEGGAIRVTVRESITRENKDRLTVTIADNGIGMSPRFQKVLFDPFSQENRDDSSEMRGSGLGLAIVKKIIDAMGGTIAVESRIGAGTRFTFSFDCDYIRAVNDSRIHAKAPKTDGTAELQGKHVLLCEDHPLNQEIAQALLADKGLLVEIADNGQAGLEAFKRSAQGFYAAVLMDIRMPVMDGYEAARAIRALDRSDAAAVPIIAMTADAFSDDVQKCLDAGMNDHIAKPIEPGILYRTLTALIGAPSAGEE